MTFISQGFEAGSATRAQLAVGPHGYNVHSQHLLRKRTDSTAVEFEDVGTERGREKCCFSLSSGCHVISEECCGSSGSPRATIVQAAPHLQQRMHSAMASFSFAFTPPPPSEDSGRPEWWEKQAKDKKMAGVAKGESKSKRRMQREMDGGMNQHLAGGGLRSLSCTNSGK